MMTRRQPSQPKRSAEAIEDVQDALQAFFHFQQKQRQQLAQKGCQVKRLTMPSFKQRVKSHVGRVQAFRDKQALEQAQLATNQWNREHRLDNNKLQQLMQYGNNRRYKVNGDHISPEKQRACSLKARFSQRSPQGRVMTVQESRVGQLHGRRVQIIKTSPATNMQRRQSISRANTTPEQVINTSSVHLRHSQESISIGRPIAVNNFIRHGEKPILSETFYLPHVNKLDPATQPTPKGAKSSRSKQQCTDFSNMLQLTSEVPPARNLSAIAKRSDRSNMIGDITVRSMQRDNSSSSSRRVIQIAKVQPSRPEVEDLKGDVETSSCDTLVDESHVEGSRMLPMISCLDSISN